MLAQRRGRDLAAPMRKATVRSAATATGSVEPASGAGSPDVPPAERARKLSFKDKHALETLPATMEKLSASITKLCDELVDPTLYSRDKARFDAVTRELADAQARLSTAEDEWLRLEMLREELDGR
jgi:ATP-binding cassette subfamily F protein uup